MDTSIRKSPKKEYVLEFWRQLEAFRSDITLTEFINTPLGRNLKRELSLLAIDLECMFPYLKD